MLKTGRRVLLACFLVLMASAASAAPANVAILLSEESGPYLEASNGVRSTLERASGRVAVNVFSLSGKALDLSRDRPDLVVAVGVRAAQEMAAQSLPIPVLATLIPHQAFEKIAKQRDRKLFSAVFLDQPLARQMDLIRAALPERARIGVLLGPESQESLKVLQAAAKEARLGLTVETISAADELLPALQRVLTDSEVLLAVPDSLVFNRGTVQSLLLTTYRYQNPVIGFSLAYVKAGALTAVYTTPEQAGRQTGEVILGLPTGRSSPLPSPAYPKYFSVGVNYQVARSLSLSVGDEATLYQKLKRAAEPE
jgi:putative tryptophan/tyrosine transport system substrate-binding protein